MNIYKNNIKHNIAWNIGGNVAGRVLTPLFQILIARLLSPEDYGLFALLMAFIYFNAVFKEMGITESAIVTTRDIDYVSLQFSTQLITGVVFYFLLMLTLGETSEFLGEAELKDILPMIGLVFVFNALIDPYMTKYLRKQNYKKIAIRQVLSPFVTGLIGLILATHGYGVYSLIYGYLAGQFATVVLFVKSESLPRFKFNIYEFNSLFILGKHILIQRISGFVANHADAFVVSSYLGPNKLGIYKMAQQLVQLIPGSIFTYANQVMFTEFTQRVAIKDYSYIEKNYYRYVYLTGLLLFIYSVLVFFFAESVIRLVLGEQWEGLVGLVELLSVSVITGFMTAPNMDLAKILNFTHRYSYFSIIRSLVTITGVLISAQFGLNVIIIVWVVIGLISNLINEIIFYRSQSIVCIKLWKIVLYFSVWIWAGCQIVILI